MNKLKNALEKLLAAAHPAYVSDSHFQKKLIAARDNAFQVLESHRFDAEDYIADAGKMVSLRDQFAMQAAKEFLAGGYDCSWEEISKDAYKFADIMLKEREK